MGLFSSCFLKEDNEMIELPIGTIRKLVRNYLQKDIPSKLGYLEGIENCSVPDVDICTDVLMYAELRGNNQGIVKLLSNALKENPNAEAISVTHESSVSAKVNGGQRIGICVVSRAVDIAINKAAKRKIGIVGCSNYSSATGAIGYWARKIAKSGNIAIVMSQCNELVAPHGSYEPIFGTNPIAFGIPLGKHLNGEPKQMVFDMATSAEAYFGIMMAALANESIAGDVAYDSLGRETTDPKEALKGALRVFDRGYKGSGLALMIELLAGALTGASMENKIDNKNWGSLVIAINPKIFGDEPNEFYKRAESMCLRVHQAKRLHQNSPIYLPGERGDEIEKANLEKGHLKILKSTYDKMVDYIRLNAYPDSRYD